MNRIVWVTAVFAGLMLAGCASRKTAAPAEERHCFNAASVGGYTVVDRETVRLNVGPSDTYEIKLLGVCPNIQWNEQIRLETAGSATVCTGLDLTIHAEGPTGPQECAADSIRKVSP